MVPNDEALYESVVFLDYFSDLPDPRQLIQNRLNELLPWNWKKLREQIDTAQAA